MIERIRNYGIVGVFGLLFVVLAFTSPSFLSLQNGANILDQSSVLLILAATTTVCIIAGIFDLSIAAVATASAIMTVNAINAVGLVGGVILGVLFGALLGLITGVAITKTNVNSFIGTLAASFTYRGLGLILAAGGLVTIENEQSAQTLRDVMEGKYLGLKGAVWIAIGFVILVGVVLAYTVWGKKVYAVGGNWQAARLAGIRSNRVLISCYVLSGIGAGVAGVIYAGRYGTGATNAYPDSYAFTAIAATVVGGVSIFGGSGAVWRGTLGILTFALIGNGLNLLGVDTTYQQTILGLLIFAAVAADQVFRRKSA
ncbi:MAG: ABC transporter permease [Actinobacteria bacterium]|jgi:ribose transport system permease protein|nr:ABC transporter permease [Actinomycetota bacterium]